MMRFLANENVPGAAVRCLAEAGHDVAWVRATSPGIADSDVPAWAIREHRILLTFDKDFADLARTTVMPRSVGIILFRLPVLPAREAGRYLTTLVTSRDDWAGNFSVLEPGRVRMRRRRAQ
jgi:predicted nuclease of predicted toxin-antitoxin system